MLTVSLAWLLNVGCGASPADPALTAGQGGSAPKASRDSTAQGGSAGGASVGASGVGSQSVRHESGAAAAAGTGGAPGGAGPGGSAPDAGTQLAHAETGGHASSDTAVSLSLAPCPEPSAELTATVNTERAHYVPDAADPPCAVRVYQARTYCGCPQDVAGCGERGACIHWTTNESIPTTASDSACLCLPAYAGPSCGECAPGYVDSNGACVTPCEAAGLECSDHATCNGDPESPACVCDTGYAGAGCETCAEGFVLESLAADEFRGTIYGCRPVCPECGPGQVCVTTPAPPYCACNSAYAEAEDGTCRWNTDDLELPESADACGRWAFYRPRDSTPNVSVSVEEGSLVLGMDNACSVLVAATLVNLPDSSTLAAPSVRVTAVVEPGSYLGVSFGDPDVQEDSADYSPEAVIVRGSGEEITTDVCIPAQKHGVRTGLLLWIRGQGGFCLQDAPRVAISRVGLVSSSSCVEVSWSTDGE